MPSLDLQYILLQLGGLLVVFIVAVLRPRITWVRDLFIFGGIGLHLAWHLPDGGKEMCSGLLTIPPGYLLAHGFGRMLGDLLTRSTILHGPRIPDPEIPGPRCHHCGYLLIGLTGCICPECGEPFRLPDDPPGKPAAAESPPQPASAGTKPQSRPPPPN